MNFTLAKFILNKQYVPPNQLHVAGSPVKCIHQLETFEMAVAVDAAPAGAQTAIKLPEVTCRPVDCLFPWLATTASRAPLSVLL